MRRLVICCYLGAPDSVAWFLRFVNLWCGVWFRWVWTGTGVTCCFVPVVCGAFYWFVFFVVLRLCYSGLCVGYVCCLVAGLVLMRLIVLVLWFFIAWCCD